jgi:hypothetical protein
MWLCRLSPLSCIQERSRFRNAVSTTPMVKVIKYSQIPLEVAAVSTSLTYTMALSQWLEEM